MYCFADIGVPKNPANPYYQETDPVSNPLGYNPLGINFIDWGLGRNPRDGRGAGGLPQARRPG
jgi:hypothetical protein